MKKDKLIQIGIMVLLGLAVLKLFPNLFPKEFVGEEGYEIGERRVN